MTNNHCQKHKEKFQKEARERYQNPFVEVKKKTKKGLRQISKSFCRRKRKRKKASISLLT